MVIIDNDSKVTCEFDEGNLKSQLPSQFTFAGATEQTALGPFARE